MHGRALGLTQAGAAAKAEEVAAAKSQAWGELVRGSKLRDLALLRHGCNLLAQAPEPEVVHDLRSDLPASEPRLRPHGDPVGRAGTFAPVS